MKIYLLRVTDEQTLFYAEPAVEEIRETKEEATAGGLRGWLSEKYVSLQKALVESESGTGLRMRRMWEWLQRRMAVDEQMIRSLRVVHQIELHHPSSFSPAQARETWDHYLANRRRHFLLWFVLNLLVTPVTLLLAPVPGPNVIGWWFCYRAICHALSLLGIRRAGEVEYTTRETNSLDVHLAEVDEEHIAHLARDLNLHGLSFYVKRAIGDQIRPHAAKLPASQPAR